MVRGALVEPARARGGHRGRGRGRARRRGAGRRAADAPGRRAARHRDAGARRHLGRRRARRARCPGRASLILTTFGRPGYLRRALEQGASGFLLKDAPARELAAAIRAVARGVAGGRPGARGRGARWRATSPLTAREARGAGRGGADTTRVAEIARSLHLSEGTVRNYLSASMRKLGARNRGEAIDRGDARRAGSRILEASLAADLHCSRGIRNGTGGAAGARRQASARRLPDPRARDQRPSARVPRLGVEHAEAAGGDRQHRRHVLAQLRERAPRRVHDGRGDDGALRGRPRDGARRSSAPRARARSSSCATRPRA